MRAPLRAVTLTALAGLALGMTACGAATSRTEVPANGDPAGANHSSATHPPHGATVIVEGGEVDRGPFKGYPMLPERPAPDFSLSAGDGAPFTLSSTKGEVVLLFFGYASCPDVCPLTLNKLSAGLAQANAAGDVPARVVFVSVDPDRDTPAVLSEYSERFPGAITAVTGTLDELQLVARDYRVMFMKDFPAGASELPANYTMTHPTSVYVVDPDGQLRLMYAADFTAEDVAHDIGVLLGATGT